MATSLKLMARNQRLRPPRPWSYGTNSRQPIASSKETMCITEVWIYRECGCRYDHRLPCHPFFGPSQPDLAADVQDCESLENGCTASAQPLAEGADLISNDPKSLELSSLERQCPLHHVVHRNFLEPICDDCLLEELGLRPELGPILGGRDRQAEHPDQNWILESNVEIEVEEPAPKKSTAVPESASENGDMADDEDEFRGRSQRRRGIDISREDLRISPELSLWERLPLASCREELREKESEGTTQAKSVIKTIAERGIPTAKWLKLLDKGLVRKRDRCRATDSASELGGRPASSDSFVDLRRPLDATGGKRDSSWQLHLRTDLSNRRLRRQKGTSCVQGANLQRGHAVCSAPSSPQTVTPLSSGTWPRTEQPLNIPSSEFDSRTSSEERCSPPTHPHGQVRQEHAHTASTDTTSSFCTAHSTPSPHSKTNPTTTTSTLLPELSIHSLETPLNVSAPIRPSLAQRSSSTFSPPAHFPLLLSTPSLHQSPICASACIHEQRRYGCGCTLTSVVNCLCADRSAEGDTDSEQRQADPKNRSDVSARCLASAPVIQIKRLPNQRCKRCLSPEQCIDQPHYST